MRIRKDFIDDFLVWNCFLLKPKQTGKESIKFSDESQMALGVSYDSSPVDDDDRTLDLPFDKQIK